MKTTQNRKYNFGFTLIEVMITIAILAIFTGLTAPSYCSLIANNTANNLAITLNSTIKIAKGEAIRQGKTMQVCPLVSPTALTCAPASTTSWQNGWMISDQMGNPVKVFTPSAPQSNAITVSPATTMFFSPSGSLSGTTNFVFTIQPQGCTTGYCVQVNINGQTTSQSKNCQTTCP